MLKKVKNLGADAGLVAAFLMSMLPIPMISVPAFILRHRGYIGDTGMGLGMAGSLMAAFFLGSLWMLRIGRSMHTGLLDPVPETSQPPGDLRCDQGLFEAFMAHLPALAFLKDRRGRYLYVNAACLDMWKRTPEEVIGRSDRQLWPDEIAGPLCQNDAQIMGANQVFSAVDRIVVGAEERYHLMTKFAIVNAQQAMLGGIAFDITDKVRAEEENTRLEQQLIQSQKMEAIGTLSGGIAHDFNNVLSAIMGYVELAQLNTVSGNDIQFELAQVLKAAHRARDLVQRILTFSRKTEHDRQPIDPKPLVQETLTLLRASIPSTIEIRHSFDVQGVQILTNATQFHQVMMNLCTNAAHAMEATGGVLAVNLQKVSLTGATAARQGVAPGRYLEVRVRDSGPGIPPALRRRIFDPYFTTKAQGKGSGMGLAVVRSIVESHGGSIDVEDRAGEGACFFVLLPITTRLAEINAEKMEVLPRGTESILLVDDEPVLVELGKHMLSRLGYQVTCCERSLDALAVVQDHPDRFDLVITDITMPTMTGDVLAGRLMAIRPDMPVILCTGYSEQITSEKADQLGIAAFLMKPLAIGDLACTLRATLDNHVPDMSPHYLKAVPD